MQDIALPGLSVENLGATIRQYLDCYRELVRRDRIPGGDIERTNDIRLRCEHVRLHDEDEIHRLLAVPKMGNSFPARALLKNCGMTEAYSGLEPCLGAYTLRYLKEAALSSSARGGCNIIHR